jgi:hypothetical protein
MVMASVSGVTPGVPSQIPKVENSVTESSVVKQYDNDEISKIMSTENYVRQYFKDAPIMVQIAKCESHFRQLDSDGEIHRGRANPADVGVMQINEFYHLDTAQKKSMDIYTIEGNTAYARDLYEREGTAPWNSSKACWGKYLAKDTDNSKALAVNSNK